MVTRDDGDILAQTINHLLGMVDFLYVYDTGSLDNSWNIILEAAKSNSRLIPFKSEPAVFFTALKSYPFNEFRSRFSEGDWVMKVDSDEFYLADIREFLSQSVKWYEDVVYYKIADFRFSSEDLLKWEQGEETLECRDHPIQARRRYYISYPYGEARIYRYRASMKWHPSCNEPYYRGVVARNRIPIAHYPDRDPVQMHRRWSIRKFAQAKGLGIGRADAWGAEGGWQARVVDIHDPQLRLLEKGGQPVLDETSWHLPSISKRIVSFLFYRTVSRLMDQFVQRFPSDFMPILYTQKELEALRKSVDGKAPILGR